MKFVAVVPSIHPEWTADCVESWHHPVYVHDNTEVNIGTTGAWNVGIDLMFEQGADWLILMSAAMMFGERHGDDFLASLEEHPNAHFVTGGIEHHWHLMAFHRRTIEAVGRFDENFWPYGMDDADYGLRMQRTFPEVDSHVALVDVTDRGAGHSLTEAGVRIDHAVFSYYRAKWGGDKMAEQFDHPFNVPFLPLSWWPTPVHPGARSWLG